MFLIENMIKRGLSLQETISLAEKKRINLTAEEIKEEFYKETKQVKEDDEKLKKMFNILKNQSSVDLKANMIDREFKDNGGQLRPGYISNLYFNSTIEENEFLLEFLFRRVSKNRARGLVDYNKEYLENISKRNTRELKKYGVFSKKIIIGEQPKPPKKEKPIKKEEGISKKINLLGKIGTDQSEVDESIIDMIEEMKRNAKKLKGSNNRQSNQNNEKSQQQEI